MEKYKTFFPRFVALLIDSFIMLPIAISGAWFQQAEFPSLFFYIWIPLSALVVPVYTILMHGFYGQTLGKMFMNVKVLNAAEEPMNFQQAFVRELPQLIFNAASVYIGIKFLGADSESENFKNAYTMFVKITGIWNLADIFTFFMNEKRRALHDFLAGTQVIKIKL